MIRYEGLTSLFGFLFVEELLRLKVEDTGHTPFYVSLPFQQIQLDQVDIFRLVIFTP